MEILLLAMLSAPGQKWRDMTEAQLVQILQQEPDNDTAHFFLGALYYSMGRYDEAREQWEATIEANPDYPEAYFNLGILAEHEGDIARAETLYRRAIARGPGFPEPHYYLGLLLMDQGFYDEARQELNTAADLFEQQGKTQAANRARRLAGQ